MQPNEKKTAGVLGFFKDPDEMVLAMRKVREAGFASYDSFTPFPLHGMDEAMGLKRSNLPYVTFLFGLIGVISAFLLQYLTSATSAYVPGLSDFYTLRGWPLNVGGKPLNSWPAFVPVMFELTILFAGISTFVGMLAFCCLPNVTKRSFDPALTSDKFAILIEFPCDEPKAQEILKKLGAYEVRTVFHEGWF
jgi:hypothetical protein